LPAELKIPITSRDFLSMGYFVYILRSATSDKFYIGSSENPHRRLEYHNTIEKGFTSRYRPWNLIWFKEYSSKAEAKSIERKIKSWKSKKMIEKIMREEISL